MAASEQQPLPSSNLASIEHAREFRYLGTGNDNYLVKLTKATISTTPVLGGKLIEFDISAVTDQVILGGEGVIAYFPSGGDHMDSQKFNLSQLISCPVSVGDFEFKCIQVIPADINPGNYTFKLDLFNQNGRPLTSVAFDFTMPFDSTLVYPDDE